MAFGYKVTAMDKITDTRREHLENAIDEVGSARKVAALVGVTDQYMSNIRNGHREIGHKMARRLEVALGCPEGMFDQSLTSLDEELSLLIGRFPEDEVADAFCAILPKMSEESLKKISTALLARLM